MQRYFKTKRRIKIFKLNIKVLYIFVFLGVLILPWKFLSNLKLANSNENFIIGLLNDSNHHVVYEIEKNTFLQGIYKLIDGISVKSPTSMLESVFNYEIDKKESLVMNYNLNSNTKNTNESSDTQNVNKEPIVYIYNSHQSEAYNDSSDTVIKAARILKNVLEEKGVPTIFEEADILEFMRINNYDHSKSYVASSYYIKDALLKNKNLKLLIDFHRDSVSKNSSTVEIDGKSYAKVLFVVGLEHDNYQDNLTLANTLNDMINSKYKGLSRGIMQKKGAGVNGIYNQNLSPNMILLEFGGAENTIEEVENSINAIANIIKEYLGV